MRKYIIPFLAGIATTVLLSNTVQNNLLTVKPALPKSTVILDSFNGDINPKWTEYVKKGYQVKAITGNNYKAIILEKY